MEGNERTNESVDSLGRPVKKEKTPLPEVGTRFFIDGVEYKITYVNEGKSRFSAIPVN